MKSGGRGGKEKGGKGSVAESKNPQNRPCFMVCSNSGGSVTFILGPVGAMVLGWGHSIETTTCLLL